MIFSRLLPMIAALLALGLVPPATAADVAARKSAANGITVTVTPNLSDAATWSFKVVLDTHSQELSDDLVKTATLSADGKRYTPTAWEGAAPGGHHRDGVLRFTAVTPRPSAIALELRRPDESTPRVFTWQLQP